MTIADIDMADAEQTPCGPSRRRAARRWWSSATSPSSDQVKEMVDATVASLRQARHPGQQRRRQWSGTHGKPTNLEVLTEDAWDRVVDLNLKGVFLCSRAVVPHMKANGYGKIINVSSLGAISPPSPHPALSRGQVRRARPHVRHGGRAGSAQHLRERHHARTDPHAVLRRDRGGARPRRRPKRSSPSSASWRPSGAWVSPMTSPGRRSSSRPTCPRTSRARSSRSRAGSRSRPSADIRPAREVHRTMSEQTKPARRPALARRPRRAARPMARRAGSP